MAKWEDRKDHFAFIVERDNSPDEVVFMFKNWINQSTGMQAVIDDECSEDNMTLLVTL